MRVLPTVCVTAILSCAQVADAQIPYPTGEEELFNLQNEDAGGLDDHRGGIFAVFGLETTSANRYTRDLQAVVDDGYFGASLGLDGSYLLTDNTYASLQWRYLGRFGFVESDDLLPGYDLAGNHGFGDVYLGVLHRLPLQYGRPVNVTVQAGLVVPMGESEYPIPDDVDFPLGNGFWGLNLGIGISENPSPKTVLFVNGEYLTRFAREFTSDRYSSGFSRRLDPHDTKSLRGGVGVLLKENPEHQATTVLNFQAEHTWVGMVEWMSPPYKRLQVGADLVFSTPIGSYSSFVGVEIIEGTTFFVLEAGTSRLGLRMFGVEF